MLWFGRPECVGRCLLVVGVDGYKCHVIRIHQELSEGGPWRQQWEGARKTKSSAGRCVCMCVAKLRVHRPPRLAALADPVPVVWPMSEPATVPVWAGSVCATGCARRACRPARDGVCGCRAVQVPHPPAPVVAPHSGRRSFAAAFSRARGHRKKGLPAPRIT